MASNVEEAKQAEEAKKADEAKQKYAEANRRYKEKQAQEQAELTATCVKVIDLLKRIEMWEELSEKERTALMKYAPHNLSQRNIKNMDSDETFQTQFQIGYNWELQGKIEQACFWYDKAIRHGNSLALKRLFALAQNGSTKAKCMLTKIKKDNREYNELNKCEISQQKNSERLLNNRNSTVVYSKKLNFEEDNMNLSKISSKAIEETKKTFIAKSNVSDISLPDGYDINENPETKKAYELIKQGTPVVFLTGGAGTGKSTFIKYLQQNLRKEMNKNCVVLAPTGIAAINVQGQTIHSFFGFKTDIFENSKITKSMKNPVLDHTDLIIIDEISMVSSWMIDHIDYALRLWCDKNMPFGGKQMLFIGDCFQLPPVVKTDDEEANKFIEQWKSPFFFAAKAFENVEVEAVQLKKIYRQKGDKSFIHMLNRIRKCQHGFEEDIHFLNQKCFIETRIGTSNVPEECILLTTTNKEAEKFNGLKMFNLNEQGAKSKTYDGIRDGDFDLDQCITPFHLELCIGAKVMITKNIPTLHLVNGDMGKVVGFGERYVEVEVKGSVYQLEKAAWQSLKYKWDEESKTIKQFVVGSFSQIPLKLGWAVTIHKSQGLTLDSIAIDAADSWDSGQVYVALSRAKNLNGILLKQRIPVSVVRADEYIKNVYNQLFPESAEEDVFDENEYKNIILDNSIFTITTKKEITNVYIGKLKFELYPAKDEKIQAHVRRTMDRLLENNLIPAKEEKRLLTDEEYCYNTFGICYRFPKWTLKFTLLRTIRQGRQDDNGVNRYWAEPNHGYYICSQWYQNCASKFALWLIALSKGTL